MSYEARTKGSNDAVALITNVKKLVKECAKQERILVTAIRTSDEYDYADGFVSAIENYLYVNKYAWDAVVNALVASEFTQSLHEYGVESFVKMNNKDKHKAYVTYKKHLVSL